MDALVYEDTPIAEYFEGEAVPYDLPQEVSPDYTPFAPRGLPDFKGRFKKIRRSATSITPGSGYTEELLERFRYVVVASQLLSDETAPRAALPDRDTGTYELTTRRGLVITITASLLTAGVSGWIQTRRRVTWVPTWMDIGIYIAGTIVVVITAALLLGKHYTNHLQRASTRMLSRYVDESHNLDTTASNILRFIREVEIVARGYDLGTMLPPISRLEDRSVAKRCQSLRRELESAMKLLTIIMVESHNAVQLYVNPNDVHRYHDIYEVSMVEYSQALALVHRDAEDPCASIKDLRFMVKLHSLTRRVFLCDLLALQQTKGWSRVCQWSAIRKILNETQHTTAAQQINLATNLIEEEFGGPSTEEVSTEDGSLDDQQTDQKDHRVKRQLRQFNNVTFSVRALNARMHLLREEISSLTKANYEHDAISSTLSNHYDTIGAELRSILSDWEKGTSCMVSSIRTDSERRSCSTSSVHTPLSASPSVTNVHIVDGGPADALRLLNGDIPTAKGNFQEEIFEAIAERLPRKRISLVTMTREEKIAKLAEERKKRATLQEQSENTTNMLRELQMVIKHRPKGSYPHSGQRVATI